MIREAETGDLADVLRLYRQMHPLDPVVADGSDAAAFERILATPELYLLVLEEDGIVVATTYLDVVPNLTRSASPYAVIENVVVDEARRGTGLGRRLVAATLQRAWDAGC
jgi:GNAT superfamily N-acetyltransferase